MRICPPALVAVLLLVLAGTAQAAEVRYAAPGGSDSASCSPASPCSLATAVDEAPDESEVVVEPGSYLIAEHLLLGQDATLPRHDVDLHGNLSAPMPTIEYAPEAFSGRAAIELEGEGSSASWLHVKAVDTAYGALAFNCSEGASLERVRAEADNAGNPTIAARACDVSDSLALSIGESAAALLIREAAATNDTAIATGDSSVAIATRYDDVRHPPVSKVEIVNTIARGGGEDIEATGEPSAGETQETAVSHSNYDPQKLREDGGSIVQAAGNQSAMPLFSGAAAGDFEEAAGSPTVDAGVATPTAGALDLAGKARSQGGGIDIGAYELPRAAASPPPSSHPSPKPAVGEIERLSVLPRSFAAARSGEAVTSKKRPRGPVGGAVVYTLSAAAEVSFSLERIGDGRRSGKRCVRQSRRNRGKQPCDLFKPLPGSFVDAGSGGLNTFDFSGRLDGRALAPGRYLLVGRAGGVAKTALFSIVP